MWQGFSRVFLTAVWFGSKMRPNPMEIPSFVVANAMEIPWLELVQNPCHVPAWKTNRTWINDMEWSWNLVSISTKLSLNCDMKWHGISMRIIHVTFCTGIVQILLRKIQNTMRRKCSILQFLFLGTFPLLHFIIHYNEVNHWLLR